jgi:hypothetical protein
MLLGMYQHCALFASGVRSKVWQVPLCAAVLVRNKLALVAS